MQEKLEKYFDLHKKLTAHGTHSANFDEKVHIPHNKFEYFYQCITTFWCLRDSKGPIFIKPIEFKINVIDHERRFVNLFGKLSPLCGTAI